MEPKIWNAYVAIVLTIIMFNPLALAQVLTPVNNLEVVDAAGRKVGNVIDLQEHQFPIVTHSINGQLFTITVAENALTGNFLLFFQSADCSGTPFLPDNSIRRDGVVMPLLPPVAIVPPGSTLYLPDPRFSSQDIAVRSVQFSTGICQVLAEFLTGAAL